MTALEDIQLKRQQAASLVKERRDREDLARTVVESITDKGIRIIAELDTTKATKDQLDSLEKLRSVIAELENSGKQADNEQKSLLKELIHSVKALEMAPTVNVAAQKAPSIVNKVDLSPLQETLQDLLTPEDTRTDLSRYRAQDIRDSGDIQYVGFLNPEGNWYIIENDVKKNQMRYLFGVKGYANHFKNAGSYVYKLMDEAINAPA